MAAIAINKKVAAMTQPCVILVMADIQTGGQHESRYKIWPLRVPFTETIILNFPKVSEFSDVWVNLT